ncbi:MAG: hypothetical protein WDN28_28435 [Chthoniobacter sp.]
MNVSIRRFRALAAHYLDETHRLFPQVASERGLHEFDALLGQNDAATHREFLALAETTLRDVEALPDFAFTGDDWLDRRGLLALLRTERFFHDTFPHWRINPQVHCGTAIDSIFSLVVRHAGNLRPAREAIEARLAALPRFLEQGAACLRQPVPLWTKLTRQSCDGAKSFSKRSARKSRRSRPSRPGPPNSSRTPSPRCNATLAPRRPNRPGQRTAFPWDARTSNSSSGSGSGFR